MNYRKLFNSMHNGFFDETNIKSMPESFGRLLMTLVLSLIIIGCLSLVALFDKSERLSLLNMIRRKK